MKAIVIDKTEDAQRVSLKEHEGFGAPGDGQVCVAVEYSTINYKDALAISGASPVVRSFPLIPGIDFAGTVTDSAHEKWQRGDRVLLNGWGVGEAHNGGLAQQACVSGDWLQSIPDAFDSRSAMAIGTAGYTASLCVDALVNHGLEPDSGPVLVTGASGGVGSLAIALLSAAGYTVTAVTGKTAEESYLRALGAREILDRAELGELGKPLQKERWSGVVDAVGGATLANACAQTSYRGAVAACGLAQSMKFPSTVMPFILRGVTLYGIDSVMAPMRVRELAWARLARDLDIRHLDAVISEISLAESIRKAGDVLSGAHRGRFLVDVNR
ncbi:alcohol dehydrogenase, zinc-binding [Luminiphilus syltensis NOR5-1B]|uniref:Alcohol dehydrogenase, zinc-binding n=1 Tax=Luminiphilus syltensis NOR5-1B TaxID=565045 RepID=B8KSA3_9GAMM|nr:MDR family oxidoreductase [Luminiphilus syltensis]EED36557.1 alcohol dehydrogenase, zinc-binding [Luminiphilus syltensis NOR5-1B]